MRNVILEIIDPSNKEMEKYFEKIYYNGISEELEWTDNDTILISGGTNFCHCENGSFYVCYFFKNFVYKNKIFKNYVATKDDVFFKHLKILILENYIEVSFSHCVYMGKCEYELKKETPIPYEKIYDETERIIENIKKCHKKFSKGYLTRTTDFIDFSCDFVFDNYAPKIS